MAGWTELKRSADRAVRGGGGRHRLADLDHGGLHPAGGRGAASLTREATPTPATIVAATSPTTTIFRWVMRSAVKQRRIVHHTLPRVSHQLVVVCTEKVHAAGTKKRRPVARALGWVSCNYQKLCNDLQISCLMPPSGAGNSGDDAVAAHMLPTVLSRARGWISACDMHRGLGAEALDDARARRAGWRPR